MPHFIPAMPSSDEAENENNVLAYLESLILDKAGDTHSRDGSEGSEHGDYFSQVRLRFNRMSSHFTNLNRALSGLARTQSEPSLALEPSLQPLQSPVS
jgi:hypothetical protein